MKILIKDTNLLTMTQENNTIKGDIAIEGNIIKFIGDIPEEFKPDKVIDGKDKLAMPGLVNSHTHIAMSLFRNYADDLPLWSWLTEKIWPLEEKLTPEYCYWGSMLSIVEMIKSGTTCFADMYFFMDETAKAIEQSGIRASICRGLIGDKENGLEKLEANRELYKKWHRGANERINVMVGPHAPYTCDDYYLKKTIELARELNTGLHIHLSESAKEVKDSYDALGKSPIEHVNDLGLFDGHTLAAHCVHLSDRDIEIISEKNVNIANNPGSNLKLGNGFAEVDKLLKRGINVALGTDGSSSNNNLNMFEEINLAAIINKGINQDPISVSAYTALEMATKNGAKALMLENEVGTIEVGKKADIVLIDLNKPHFYPRHNLISAMAYSAQASDVDTVIVDGKILMESYEFKTLDVEKIMFNASRCANELIKL
ncbi:amidohydrolase [Abyssisolibacter fermentans]|uniref:amidohydrolase n=1 Tax=Abyssisolibacter fermentans TaxID=1766203 RepID=UPI000835854E|nr:amidohydrolase [Abyssisolibacter fermentans]